MVAGEILTVIKQKWVVVVRAYTMIIERTGMVACQILTITKREWVVVVRAYNISIKRFGMVPCQILSIIKRKWLMVRVLTITTQQIGVVMRSSTKTIDITFLFETICR